MTTPFSTAVIVCTSLCSESFAVSHKWKKLNSQQLKSYPAFPAFIVLCIATCVGVYCCIVVLLWCITVNVLYLQIGSTPLCVASQNRHLPVVERLIAAKADVNHHMKVSR